MSKELKKILEDSIEQDGIKMYKKISSGGIFAAPTYDQRVVYSWEELRRLLEEGFTVDANTGHLAFSWLVQLLDEGLK